MPRTNLLTLLHISDLHFRVSSADDGQPPKWWRHFPATDGWWGHDVRALEHLEDFVIDLRDESPYVVLTGDVTACGKVEEFALAKQFISASIPTTNRTAGLYLPDLLARSISGNHDQWPGSLRVVGKPTAGLGSTMPKLPFTPMTIRLKNGKRLTLIGIDSDADVFAGGLTRFLARGKFVSQLVALQKQIGPAAADEIRVMLIHHSPAYDATRSLAIADNSQAGLREFINQYGISVLLTGHIHRTVARVTTAMLDSDRWRVLEARCGTTTQTDQVPIEWAAEGTIDRRRFPRNTLLVHRLIETNSRIEWHTELYGRYVSGFSKPIPLMKPVTVWPRMI
jgi:3',5'-cyclic AMP phosphodiesterase CpdA